jgi:hypothetical protein
LKIINAEKTKWSSTDLQIFYLAKCGNITRVDEMSKIGVSEEAGKEMVCNVLPGIEDLSEDPCFVLDYLRVKYFCLEEITEQEKEKTRELLAKDYATSYLISCQNLLSRFVTDKNILI